jgi:hypothetical protein
MRNLNLVKSLRLFGFVAKKINATKSPKHKGIIQLINHQS